MKRILLTSAMLTMAVHGYGQSIIEPIAQRTIEEAREELRLPHYSREERQRVLHAVEMTLGKIFVHRDLKIKEFGESADPMPKLAEIARDIDKLSDEEFHGRLQKTFTDLHDLHTLYIMPSPYGCSEAYVPLAFGEVVDNNKRAIVLRGVARGLPPEIKSRIHIGDRLLEVNGEPVEAALFNLMKISSGANEEAMRYRAIELISMRSLAMHPFPKENTLRFKLQGPNGTYIQEFSWNVVTDNMCVALAEGRLKNEESEFLPEVLTLGIDKYQHNYTKRFGKRSLLKTRRLFAEEENPMSDILEAGIIPSPGGDLAYINLKSFMWNMEMLSEETIISYVKSLLEEPFKDTKGLVIDVRGNGGGIVTLAERLVQLMSPQGVRPTSSRMLANSLNKSIFYAANDISNRWSDAVEKAMADKKTYSDPIPFTTLADANRLGQAWFKPVVVLTDAGCYSACDIFAASMQDNGAATIIGNNNTTGAGGANVMQYSTFQKIFIAAERPSPFKDLPYGQDMTVAWRQAIRSGKSNGQILENIGVISDKIIRISSDEVRNGKAVMASISEAIDAMAPRLQSSVETINGNVLYFENGKPAVWTEYVKNVDELEVLTTNGGKLITTVPAKAGGRSEEVRIQLDNVSGEWEDRYVHVIGKQNGRTVFRVLRELSWRGEYVSLNAGDSLVANFKGMKELPDFIKSTVVRGKPENGWTLYKNVLKIGSGEKYANNLHAKLIMPLDLTNANRALLLVRGGILAEELSDSLRIEIINTQNGDRKVIASISMSQISDMQAMIPTGSTYDVVIEFESDENWNMLGPIIQAIAIQTE
jgi:C-terminal processing protease CtpA/Prc